MTHHDHKRFIADVMVGRLARYLRMAGYDVSYSNEADDDQILEKARREDRIVLTRDTMMLKRRDFTRGFLKSVYITDDSLKKQLLQVMSCFGLRLEPNLLRCLECNSSLDEVKKSGLEDKVPPYVFKTQENFRYCSRCNKYYWRGTHFDYMKKYFSDLNRSI
jgi:uncharacterized protein with PIN domain